MISYEIITKFILSIFLGSLIGLERTYSKKQYFLGVRTFAILSTIGFLSYFIPNSFNTFLIIISGIFLIFYYLKVSDSIGLTSIFAAIYSFIQGYFIASGYVYETIFITITIVIILYSKEKLRTHLRKITKKDMEDFLEFISLLGLVYPFIPDKYTLLNITIPIKEIYLLIIALSIINFIAYILSKILDPKKETFLISFLGGLIDSTSSCFTLTRIIKNAYLLIIATTIASLGMAARNFFLAFFLKGFSIKLFLILLIVGICSIIYIFINYRKINKEENEENLIKIEKPFGVTNAIKVASFVFLFILSVNILQNFVNENNLYIFFLISSFISTTATTISLFSTISDPIKYFPVVFIGGFLSNIIPLIYYKRKKETMNYLIFSMILTLILIIISITL